MTKGETKTLDTMWSKLVKEEAGNRCEICGKTEHLNSHHYIGRRSRSTRWYMENGCCLCCGCHKLSLWSAHENPEWFRSQMLDRRGTKWLKDLQRQANKVFKGTSEQVKKYLKGETKNYA